MQLNRPPEDNIDQRRRPFWLGGISVGGGRWIQIICGRGIGLALFFELGFVVTRLVWVFVEECLDGGTLLVRVIGAALGVGGDVQRNIRRETSRRGAKHDDAHAGAARNNGGEELGTSISVGQHEDWCVFGRVKLKPGGERGSGLRIATHVAQIQHTGLPVHGVGGWQVGRELVNAIITEALA